MANDLFALLQLIIVQIYPTKLFKGCLYDQADSLLANLLFLLFRIEDGAVTAGVRAGKACA